MQRIRDAMLRFGLLLLLASLSVLLGLWKRRPIRNSSSWFARAIRFHARSPTTMRINVRSRRIGSWNSSCPAIRANPRSIPETFLREIADPIEHYLAEGRPRRRDRDPDHDPGPSPSHSAIAVKTAPAIPGTAGARQSTHALAQLGRTGEEGPAFIREARSVLPRSAIIRALPARRTRRRASFSRRAPDGVFSTADGVF